MNKMRILILEHDSNDIELLQYELKRTQLEHEARVVSTRKEFEKTLEEFRPDIILSDYSLPSFDGLSAFQIKEEKRPEIPFIIVSGTIGDEKAVDLIKMGVTDYVLKDNIYQVTPKIKRAINEAAERVEKKEAYLKLSESEIKYRSLFQFSPMPMWVFNPASLYFLDVNEAAIAHYGYSLKEFLSMTIKDIHPQEEMDEVGTIVKNAEKEDGFYRDLIRHRKKNGELIHVHFQSNFIDFQGQQARLALAIDVTDRLARIREIEDQNRRLQEIAWIQSHIVRAPLARILGLCHCLEKYPGSATENAQLLGHIVESAQELDEVIRDIVSRTEKVNIDSNALEGIGG